MGGLLGGIFGLGGTLLVMSSFGWMVGWSDCRGLDCVVGWSSLHSVRFDIHRRMGDRMLG